MTTQRQLELPLVTRQLPLERQNVLIELHPFRIGVLVLTDDQLIRLLSVLLVIDQLPDDRHFLELLVRVATNEAELPLGESYLID